MAPARDLRRRGLSAAAGYTERSRGPSPGWSKRRRRGIEPRDGGPAGKPAVPVAAVAPPRLQGNELAVLSSRNLGIPQASGRLFVTLTCRSRS